MGELIERKNQISAIKAVSKLKDENVMFLICGRGEKENELKEAVIKYGVENKTIFCGFRNDINEILKIADLFIFPSFQEGLPVSVIEAMAAGLPVVCSDIRGNRDLIENGKGGFLHNPTDVNAICRYIKKLKNNQKIRENFGKYNINASDKYDIDHVMKKMIKIYENTLEFSL